MTAAPIKLHWWKGVPNFGDAISALVVAYVSGRPVEHASPATAELFATKRGQPHPAAVHSNSDFNGNATKNEDGLDEDSGWAEDEQADIDQGSDDTSQPKRNLLEHPGSGSRANDTSASESSLPIQRSVFPSYRRHSTQSVPPTRSSQCFGVSEQLRQPNQQGQLQ